MKDWLYTSEKWPSDSRADFHALPTVTWERRLRRIDVVCLICYTESQPGVPGWYLVWGMGQLMFCISSPLYTFSENCSLENVPVWNYGVLWNSIGRPAQQVNQMAVLVITTVTMVMWVFGHMLRSLHLQGKYLSQPAADVLETPYFETFLHTWLIIFTLCRELLSQDAASWN